MIAVSVSRSIVANIASACAWEFQPRFPGLSD